MLVPVGICVGGIVAFFLLVAVIEGELNGLLVESVAEIERQNIGAIIGAFIGSNVSTVSVTAGGLFIRMSHN